MIKKAVVDFSAFVGPTVEPVIKELSIVDIDSMCAQHWIFKPPKDEPVTAPRNDRNWMRQNTWIGKFYHGIDFSSGYTDYAVLERALDLCVDVQLLYAPTQEKTLALEELLHYTRTIFSLETLGCDVVPDVTKRLKQEDGEVKECLYHHLYAPGFNFTLKNVRVLADLCKRNLAKIDMNNVKNREKSFGDWPCAHPTARELAEQGFLRVHSTKYVYCNVVLHRWMPQDCVEGDHENNSPFCKFPSASVSRPLNSTTLC